MIVTATHLKINSFSGYFRFILHAMKVKRQLDKSDGLLFLTLKGTRTLSGWKDISSMKAFRNNDAHLQAMIAAKKMGIATSKTWECDEKPSWDDAMAKLSSD